MALGIAQAIGNKGLGLVVPSAESGLSASPTPRVPARVLSNAAGTTNIFQPNVNRPCFVSYSCKVSLPISLLAQDGEVELRWGSVSPPVAFRLRMGLALDLGGVVGGVGGNAVGTVGHIIPAGYFVAIVPITVAPAPTFAITDQVETDL